MKYHKFSLIFAITIMTIYLDKIRTEVFDTLRYWYREIDLNSDFREKPFFYCLFWLNSLPLQQYVTIINPMMNKRYSIQHQSVLVIDSPVKKINPVFLHLWWGVFARHVIISLFDITWCAFAIWNNLDLNIYTPQKDVVFNLKYTFDMFSLFLINMFSFV